MNIVKVLVFVFLLGCGSNNKLDKTACEVFENRLLVVKNFVDGRDADSSLRRTEAIDFLENLTGIESESDRGYVGKLNPTSNDYREWLGWYKANQKKIYWNTEKQKVFVKK